MMLELFILILVCLATLFYFTNKRPPNYAPVARISFPVLGHFPYFGKYDKIGLFKLFMDWSKECKSSVIGVDFGSYRAVILTDVNTIKLAFSNPATTGRLDTRCLTLRGGDDGVNRGLIFSDGHCWTEQRRFSFRHLKEFGFGKKSMESIILTEVEELVRGFKSDAGTPISTSTRFNAAVVNTLWQICAGERFSHDDTKLADLVTAIIQNIQGAKTLGTLIFMPWFCRIFPKLSGWTAYEKNFYTMNNFISEYALARIAKHQTDDHNDFIDVYISEMKNCSDSNSSFYGEEGMKNLLNTLGDIFVAGSETTSTTLCWLSLYLSLHQNIQEEVYEEINRVIGQDRLPTLSDRDLMPYLAAVIQETLRLSSVVVLGVFHRAMENLTLDGIFIPKRTVIISNLYGVNHDPAVWGTDADEFNPSRFLSTDKTQLVKADTMLAFSTGRRICIGEALARNELFLFTASIFQKLRVHPDENSPLPFAYPNFGGTVAGPLPHKLVFTER